LETVVFEHLGFKIPMEAISGTVRGARTYSTRADLKGQSSIAHLDFWIQHEDGSETQFNVRPRDIPGIRNGHKVSILSCTGEQTERVLFGVHNHTSQRYSFFYESHKEFLLRAGAYNSPDYKRTYHQAVGACLLLFLIFAATPPSAGYYTDLHIAAIWLVPLIAGISTQLLLPKNRRAKKNRETLEAALEQFGQRELCKHNLYK